MTSREAFDELADHYDQWYARDVGQFVERQELDALRSCLPPGCLVGRWLEVGAGTGRVAHRLARWGANVTALEPSEPMLAKGVERTAQLDVTWLTGRAESLPWEDGAFAGVLFFASIEFVDDGQAALAEAVRVLALGGYLVIGHFVPGGAWTRHYAEVGARGKRPWDEARWWTEAELSKVVGWPPECEEVRVHVPYDVTAPFEVAERRAKGDRMGPSWEVLRWQKRSERKLS